MMKKIFAVLFVTLTLLSFAPISALAKENPVPVIIKADEVFEGDTFKAAEDLVFSGKVDGDLFLAGGMVTYDGETTGDLFVAGGKVTIKGKIGQSLRVAGGQVFIDSKIGRNVFAAGGVVELSENTLINGSLLALGGSLDNSAKVTLGGNLFSGRLNQNGQFGKKVNLTSENLIFGAKTKINGDLNYKTTQELSAEDKKLVSGKTFFTQMPKVEKPQFTGKNFPTQSLRSGLRTILLPLRISWLFGSFILGLVVLNLFPKYSLKISQNLQSMPLNNLLYGLAYCFLIAGVIFLLLITLIGIPLIPLVLLITGLIHFLAGILGPFAVGRVVLLKLTSQERRGWALFLGLSISFAAGFMPYLGGLYRTLLTLAATGTITNYFWLNRKK